MLTPRGRRRLVLLAVFITGAPVGVAAAVEPPNPQFKFEAPPEKPSPWKAQAKGGLLLTSGNSRSTTGSLTANAAYQAAADKFSLEAGLAYGRSSVLVPVLDANGFVTGFDRRADTTTNEWRTRLRYDRFLTANNAAYVLGQVGGDRIAGKDFYGGGQVGYSRSLIKDDRQTLVAELGYDLSYEHYLQPAGKTIDPVTIHSARVFAGEAFKLGAQSGLTASVEALFNLNEEKALDAKDTTGATKRVKAFKDTRVIGKVGLTTTLRTNLSLGLGFTVRYDQNPAPRPIPPSAKGAMYAPNFQPFSDKVDTLTDLSLVLTFL